jgi:hypothetical protein
MRSRSKINKATLYSKPFQGSQVVFVSEGPGYMNLLVGQKDTKLIPIKVGDKEKKLILANITKLGWDNTVGALTYIYGTHRHGDVHTRLARWLYMQLVNQNIDNKIVGQPELNDYRVETFQVGSYFWRNRQIKESKS